MNSAKTTNRSATLGEPRLLGTPLSDPTDILRRMPTQAISPVLLELLDLMSGPVFLFQQSPTGELREMPHSRAALSLAA